MKMPEDMVYKSNFDIDANSFMTKKIYRCGKCGDIYYASSGDVHICGSKQTEYMQSPPIPFKPIEMGKPSPGPRKRERASRCEFINFADEVYTVWRKKGYPRHQLTTVVNDFSEPFAPQEEEPASSSPKSQQQNDSDKFSFNPYDNFF